VELSVLKGLQKNCKAEGVDANLSNRTTSGLYYKHIIIISGAIIWNLALAALQVAITFVQLGFSLSNWQKVQLNTDLLKHGTRYLYTKVNGWLKLNEIKKGFIKNGDRVFN
jgi:hypothetical protein